MNIPEIIKKHHQAMIDKGFYDCPECDTGHPGQIFRYGEYMDCPVCKGSNIDPNKNIGELLMLIVSELSEALETHRKGKFAEWPIVCGSSEYKDDSKKHLDPLYFKMFLKDTFEDEIADVFLRLFDLCGYLVIDLNSITISGIIHWNSENIGDQLRELSKSILRVSPEYTTERDSIIFLVGFKDRLFSFCEKHSIPIEKHIIAKMAYNETRPHKHGKEY